ncbi:type VI secretion system-associated lipoprotein [Xenorhabdus hominickii]|uniref:Type VI secretion system-associated lipoprotein n=1 Tax=Xenorhabdus hominickii TaxID=351679 RepID=A0ABM6DX85_XENHO|nr:type VI secretion system-associated lipoprotein [Xenorhabdus hominickii]
MNGLNLIIKWLSVILLFLSLGIFTGCSFSPEPIERKSLSYKLIFNALNNVNDAAPLKLHIVFLTSNTEFMSADFFSLQDNEQTTLGNKLVNDYPFFLFPYQNKYFFGEKAPPETRYIGIFAEYKQLNGKKWRISMPVSLPEPPAFYAFWASSPDELNICIQITANGLNFINKCN